jgi:hypothetical protein
VTSAELSVPVRRLLGMRPNPWDRLSADWPDVVVEHVDLGHRWERTVWRTDGSVVIYLHRDLTQVQRRAALTHALEHLERGAPCESLRASIEQRVVDATARWLLPDVEVLAAAIGAYDCELHRVAHELWVPFRILIDRIKTLTEDEWIYIDKHREGVA